WWRTQNLLLGVFVVYALHTAWLLYGFLNSKPCDRSRGELCMASYLHNRPRLQLSVFTCLVPEDSQLHPIFRVNVSLPEETRANGTLYAVVYLHKVGVSPLEDRKEVHYAAQLTTYMNPANKEDRKDPQKVGSVRPVSHWRPLLSITMMSEDFSFSKAGLPSDVRRYMRVFQEGRQMIYLPLLLVNELSSRVKDLKEIGSSSVQLPLTISYEGISLRKFRFWIHLHDIVYSLRQFGFSEENIDEIKETLVGSNLYLLVLTALVTALQLICEFLALKNDICSWRKMKSMAGMSRKSVLWRCLCTLLIFLHLLEETSLLVLLPVGLGACVESQRTVEYDVQASRYLSYLVYPLCISGAVFSLVYLRKRNYYSWLINSLVTGVYAFGFLSMAPQLFINHKVRPTRRLFILKDELLFFLYLYQRRY
uniref:Lipid scramblase CLPTM1L n=1 Tax=Oryzias sinensis TaxID=183150 RepID=A0A8C7ZXH3_9TELE